MEKRWVLASICNDDAVTTIAEQLNIDQSLAQILVQRNICDFDQAKDFFRPDLAHLHNPFLMKDMDVAVERIDVALSNHEKILIYGDYDVDGTTSVALAFSFFSQLTPNIEYYIPDRYLEGYGISTAGIDYAKTNGFSLIIALDCGIKSIDKIDYANSVGIDFIICDHHLPGDELPKAVAVLDPKREDCNYPFKELAGCGIGFKLAQAYAQKHNLPEDSYLQYLDLVMVSIAADIVPVVDENRILAFHGLKKLNTNPCEGLRALMEVSGKTENYTITDVVFTLGPRINAAGRIDHAKHAVAMLLCQVNSNALEQSVDINSKNIERRTYDQDITREALALIGESEVLINRKTTVVFNENWHKGVIGIVASRLTEKYYRPTIVLTKSNGVVAGSCRSVIGFDLYEALSGCAHLLDQYGGHKFAAGLTMQEHNVEALATKFEEIVSASITEELLTPMIRIDAEIELAQIDGKFFRVMAQMGPFGPENMAPIFVTNNVYLAQNAMKVGANHLKINIKQQNSATFECIAFGLADFEELLQLNKPFSVCYTIEENVWREKRRLQMNIKGIKLES
ncbi:single-stranded-DNA-specific exonuclease RecJ [Pedobacter changchengzhani]|uniref:Single-stranded-DNA-specific exonuclease RecJ n=1 Tax=Pedobacter changchengzhani TaxID=2529274 RepID=A0A4R5MPZ0_9SPHI|nr:single-stranded-DNA-specific exonuclease RecJ [Pedobacter changchengzhani]TDG37902.1 single-stranded-DNA-specific exonuclease RecJ [Pedobacter changchengzhani]